MNARSRELAGRFTVQAWFQIVLGIMALLVLVCAIVGSVVILQGNRVADRLLDDVQPATAEAYRLQAALIDQETGIRGYAITADPQFFQPYLQGKQDEVKSAARLRELLADRDPLLEDLAEVEASARAWRDGYAEPLAATVTPGAPPPFDETASARGKDLFDLLRMRFTEQNDGLAAANKNDRDELTSTRSVRDGVLGGMIVAFLVASLVLMTLVRRLVAKPLKYLEDSSLRVAGGDFEHEILAHGPSDLATVATAVESMRRRVVAELAASRVQETRLAEQTANLDAQTVELRRSNAELEQFAYVASHDLQEPLRKVASFCQLLEKRYGDQLDERGTQYIAYAVDGAKRMQVLINDLLTFSRVGRVSDRTVSVELDQILDKALQNLGVAIEDTGAVVERPERMPRISGDPTLLVMLWQNLIGNAVKFRGPDRAPVIRIACEPEPGDQSGWRFTVSDNGIGIAPEFADKVFVIFQRLHSRDEYSGTGIGLALCKKIVEYHGGRIWLDPAYAETGEGTRFVFTLFDPNTSGQERTDSDQTSDKELSA
ncbi:sensor histidine kinase [Nocardia bovistercoris]|uniref:histidine kinase n=1 Tax=Nocardia bovistercoris TaxID=2785916 RepID=A0A931IHB7_9NOCA|nr:sensor histidine kinase [Nocardia bovistercoris]MBH0781391.1 CHASE3 domain-containing protein [Nocardia bovistercoris]